MKSTRLASSGTTLLLLLFAFSHAAPVDGQAARGDADRLYAQGRYAQALAAYANQTRSQSAFSDKLHAKCGAGKCLIALGRIQEALRLMQVVADLPEASAEARFILGQAWYWHACNLKRVTNGAQAKLATAALLDAQTMLDRAVKQDGRLHLAHFFLGKVKMALKQHATAAACFRQAVDLESKDTSYRLALGEALVESNDLVGAAEAFFAAAARSPLENRAHIRNAKISAACCLARAGQMRRAADELKPVFLRDPRDVALFEKVWEVFGSVRELQETGIRLLRRLERARLAAALPSYYLGRLHLARDDRIQARRAFERVLTTADGKGFAAAWAVLGEMYYVDDEALALAERHLMRALEIDPTNHRAYTVLTHMVTYWVEAGAVRRAMDLTRKILTRQPKNGHEWGILGTFTYNRALYTRTLSQSPEALRHFANAEQFAPHDPNIKCGLGKVHNALKRYDKSEAYFKAALELDPCHLETLWDYGYMCKDTRQFAKAKVLWEKLLSLDPGPDRRLDPHWSRYLSAARDLATVTRELQLKK